MKITALATIRTTKDRADPLQPSVRDAMLAAVPSLRAFAISLSGNVDRADDLVQETLLRAMANINSFEPGTNLSAWLFTILRNLFRSEYRKRRREVEDADGRHVGSLKLPPAAQPTGIRGSPRGAREAPAGPARSAHSRRRGGLLPRRPPLMIPASEHSRQAVCRTFSLPHQDQPVLGPDLKSF